LSKKGFVERLVGARHIAGLSQAELAQAVGVSKRTIEGYEQGATMPRTGITALAQALNIDPHWLLFGTFPEVEQLAEFARDLQHQTEAFHDAMRFADAQWKAFRQRQIAVEQRLQALEDLNERIYSVLAELLRREDEARGTARGGLRGLLGPALPLDEPPPELEP
jgi:transcriptional regulator with XRE-family HTH domain